MLAASEDGRAVAAIVKLIGKEIPSTVIPEIVEAELEYDERLRRGARRGAQPDNRRSTRPRDADRRPVPAEVRPRPRDHRPSASDVRVPNTAGPNVTAFPEVRRAEQHERKRQEAPKVVGFGDHLPAFLSRPPRIVARP